MDQNDITPIPQTNVRLGSCPECGKPIWESDEHKQQTPTPEKIYRCIECRYVWLKSQIIPF